MGYKITRFEVEFKELVTPVAIHTVVDGDETNYIVSIDDHENFEMKLDKNNNWKADTSADISDELFIKIIDKFKAVQS